MVIILITVIFLKPLLLNSVNIRYLLTAWRLVTNTTWDKPFFYLLLTTAVEYLPNTCILFHHQLFLLAYNVVPFSTFIAIYFYWYMPNRALTIPFSSLANKTNETSLNETLI